MTDRDTTVPMEEMEPGTEVTTPLKEMDSNGDAAASVNRNGMAGGGEQPGVLGRLQTRWHRARGWLQTRWHRALGWLQTRWQDWEQQELMKKYTKMKYCAWLLGLISLVLFIFVIVPYPHSTNQQLATTQPHTPSLRPTTTQVLTLEEQHKQEQQEIHRLPKCKLTKVSIIWEDYLMDSMPNDELHGRVLEPYTYAWRCEGVCNNSLCLPYHVEDKDRVVQYRGDNGTIMLTTRKMRDHTGCECDAF